MSKPFLPFGYVRCYSVELVEARDASQSTQISFNGFQRQTMVASPPRLDPLPFVFQQMLDPGVERVTRERLWRHRGRKYKQSMRLLIRGFPTKKTVVAKLKAMRRILVKFRLLRNMAFLCVIIQELLVEWSRGPLISVEHLLTQSIE